MDKQDIKQKVRDLGLSADNGIVIGSGILNALGIRESNDIDMVVSQEKYDELSENRRFKKSENHGKEVLDDDLFEIGTSWTVVGKTWTLDTLLEHSVVIDDTRYNKLDFYLDAKKSWVANGEARQKDIDDIKLIENYLKNGHNNL